MPMIKHFLRMDGNIFSPWRMISGLQNFSDLDCGFHHWIMISENAEWVGCGCGVTSQEGGGILINIIPFFSAIV